MTDEVRTGPVLRSLDLFSGIGGLTHALRGLGIEPLMYVEIEKHAQNVLQARINSGDLPPAPIHNDVRTLDVDMVRETDIILAGFPCIGFSTAGKRKGFENAQSGLFVEIIRLAKTIRPKYMFFENVASFRTLGLARCLSDIQELGYNCWWVTLPAFAAGAPQNRRRWYCLCVHKDAPKHTLLSDGTWKPYNFELLEGTDRMWSAKQKVGESRARSMLLGNSVVPDAVRLGFLSCWTGLRHSLSDILNQDACTLTAPTRHARRSTTPTTAGAFFLEDTTIQKVKAPDGIPAYPLEAAAITLVPNSYTNTATTPNPNQVAPRLVKPAVLRAWATPRGHMTQACNVLTSRSQRDLQTQIRFEARTPDHLRGGYANPEWIEQLMGFPQGWTRNT